MWKKIQISIKGQDGGKVLLSERYKQLLDEERGQAKACKLKIKS